MQDGRDKNEAAERDSHVNQASGEAGAAGCSVRLARHKERACPAVVACQEEADEL